ncbi:DUF4179 domain-containing protein [Bacillus sp. Bva_UNVM-123]|uniref:DUF4179 domain-containing protein n=1 Tax=Bacillus sp. Bva_UNVM-123 TaxID=2829798 RepID=UPI00391F02C8
MIPAKIDPIPTTTNIDKDVDSIFGWFDQHKQSFYKLGWCYLRHHQQMEELFYRSIIKAQKEWPRFKGRAPFEKRMTSIFIDNCRELSRDRSLQASEESEPRQGFFKALDQLKEDEKEAIVLTYVQGFSQEEVAHLLQVSGEKIKELLFSGIQSLGREWGSDTTIHGCKEYQKDYINYLERSMDRPKKIDFEVHIYHCQKCQEDLAAFQDVILNLTDRMEDLHIPSDFMAKVNDRLIENEKDRQRKIKKRKKMRLVFVSIFAFLIGIGFFTGTFTKLYYTWTEEDPELRAFLQHDLGQRLNLEAESDGVKIKIKSVIADDVQTLVFYEIEDLYEENQYEISYYNGVMVENESEIMSRSASPMHYPPDFESVVNKNEKNVFQGKMSLPPLTTDNGTIKLTIFKLQKLIHHSSGRNDDWSYDDTEFKSGGWNFEIPVTKKTSIEYALDEKMEIEGIPVRFDKLIFAPTTTILQFGINNEHPEKRIDYLIFNNLEVNNKETKVDWYGSAYLDTQYDMNWTTFQTHFDPLFGEKPKEVNAQLNSAYLTIEDNFIIDFDDILEYPYSFEYAGSSISLDRQEVGQNTNIVISNHEIENRAYEMLRFDILGEDGNQLNSIGMDFEGVAVDKNGVEYDMNKNVFSYKEIEQPRYFHTVQNIQLQNNNVLPSKLVIYEYNTTKYLDDVVKVTFE